MNIQDDNYSFNPHIGGWLLILGVFLVAELSLRIILTFYCADWNTLTSTELRMFSTEKDFLIFNTRLWVIFLIISLMNSYLFFNKKKLFRNWYIFICLLSMALEAGNISAIKEINSLEPGISLNGSKISKNLSIFGGAIFTLFFILSKRVKNTFVR